MEENKYLPELVVPRRISREFIQQHRHWLFVYSSNVFGGIPMGQAGQCLHESNCYSVPVHWRFCRSNPASWFDDVQFEPMTKQLIDQAIARIPRDGRPIIVFPKIGEGFSKLIKDAPRTYAYIHEELKKIAYPNIKWDYYRA